MAYGSGIPGGYDGGPSATGPIRLDSRAAMTIVLRPMPNAKFYPHAAPKMSVSDYVKEAAARCWFLPQYNWQNAPQPASSSASSSPA
jgi:hypothetical protein